MRSYPAALAWEFRRRHRWGLIILLIYLAILLTVMALVSEAEPTPLRMAVQGSIAATGVIPLAAAFMMMLSVFSFGFQADLSGRESIYPTRMFALPVRTAALAFWPMLYGTATAAALWLIVALAVFRPCGVYLPVVWPALLAAVVVAWTQVLMWMPYPLPLLRIFAAVILLGALVAGPQFAAEYDVPDTVLTAVLAPLLPLGYIAAWAAVGRTRCGDVPDWRWLIALPRRMPACLPRRRFSFASAARAQLWFEWRRHGRSLPLLVGLLLPFSLTLLFVADTDTPDFVLLTLVGVLLLPIFMAGFATTTVSKSNPHVRDYYGLSAFTATRPMTSAALVAAKLKMAVWSTLAAWGLVLVAIPMALSLSGNWPVVVESARNWLASESPLRAAIIVVLIALGLVVLTWKQLVQNLYIGLTGREWIIKSTVFAALALFVILGPISKWIYDHKQHHAAVLDLLPWLAGVAVFVKVAAAVCVLRANRRQVLIERRAVLAIVGSWLACVVCLFGLLAWLVPEAIVSRILLTFGTILIVPLTRPVLAPLALAWNRHR
jgi:hypothetical protein